MKKAERMKIVKQMLLKNIRGKDIAQQMGVSESTVSKYVKEILKNDNNNECLHSKINQMYLSGKSILEISFELDISKSYVNAVIKKQGLKEQNYPAEKKELIDENTVFADNRIKIEKLVIGGKKYVDIIETISPR